MSTPSLKDNAKSKPVGPGISGKKSQSKNKNPYKSLYKAVSESKVKVGKTNIPKAGKTPNVKKAVVNRKVSAADSKKGLRSFLALTPAERKRRVSVSQKIRHLLRQRKLPTSANSIDSDDDTEYDKLPRNKRYKRPVEKLLKRLKTIRKDQIPSDVNIHRRRLRRASFIGAPGVRKEVQVIYDTLIKHDKKVQPQVGWDYSKKQRRLLLGFRHRKLSNAWHYFGGIRDFFPRKIRPNSHFPDAIFIVLNLLIFISAGVTFGFTYASHGFLRIMEGIYEYDLYRKNLPLSHHEGAHFWHENVPFDYYSSWYYLSTFSMFGAQILGFIGIYVADQKIHLAYIVGMVISLLTEGINAANISNLNSCPNVVKILEQYISILVLNYYETVKVNDTNGNVVEMRTYKAANLMDQMQLNLHCCGLRSISDYTSNGMSVPPSCCTPLWNLNPHCADVIPTDKLEYRAKLQIAKDVDIGCLTVMGTMCTNIQRMMGSSSRYLNGLQWLLFFMSLAPLVLQARQIRQLKRWPHLRISAGSISQSLQASAGNEGVKTGGGGVRAVVEASKFTEKQQERLQQTRREALFKIVEPDEESSESSEESSDELPVHTVNFGQLKNLQQFVDTEDKTKLEMPDLDKTVEGFAGRFNILANKNLQNYVSGIFSTTYQNETNAGLEAIAQTLEKQFAQHTTDYNWRKLLTKPKQKQKQAPVTVTKVPRKVAEQEQPSATATEDTEVDSDES